MIPGFTPAETAVAACLVDGLDDAKGAAAAGMSESLYRKHLMRLRERFVPDWRESLRSELAAVELFECERADLVPSGRTLSSAELGPLTTGEPS